jgi:allophanate hydrolase
MRGHWARARACPDRAICCAETGAVSPPPSPFPRDDLSIGLLSAAYRSGAATVREVALRLLERGARAPERHVWIRRFEPEVVMAFVDALDGRPAHELPLYGIPFAIKDNIYLAGVPTTAACPGFAYTPTRSAGVVERLLAAGAIPLGKTNLDQFATGLVGTRSPYGACRNSRDERYVSGGSSSGSAVAVASGLVSFALGTDTAGSGRIPAAFNDLVGLKPSLGRLSTRGVVPACRSLDCVSIFALDAADAATVLDVAEGFDAEDAYSRKLGNAAIAGLRFGVPRPDQLEFFGDREYEALFGAATRRLEELGGTRVEIDFAPFLEAARLLYEGPFVAERYAAVGAFLEQHPEALHPVTRAIIAQGKVPLAAAAFEAQYRLKHLERASEAAWGRVDLILTPTAGTIPTIAAVDADPIRLNSMLGYYTNFMNLFDLTGIAVPAGFRADGLPFGITLVGRSSTERALLRIAARMQAAAERERSSNAAGASMAAELAPQPALAPQYLPMAVCGAHMEGLPLNRQLRERGGYLLARTRTAPRYRFIALPGGPPLRPGLIRIAAGGDAIDVEVWAIPIEQVGSFVAGIPAPLGIGKLELADGSEVPGFICEGHAEAGSTDITSFGGWRAYLATLSR